MTNKILAAGTVPKGQIHNPLLNAAWNSGDIGFFNRLLGVILGWAFIIAVLVFLGVFFYGGINWILAGGDENKVKGAKGRITSGLVGLVVVFLVFLILKLIGYIFGISNLEDLKLAVPSL